MIKITTVLKQTGSESSQAKTEMHYIIQHGKAKKKEIFAVRTQIY